MLQYRAYAYFSRRCIRYCGSTQLLFLLNIKRTKPSNWAYCSTAVKILNIGLFSVEPVMSHVFHIFIFLFLFFLALLESVTYLIVQSGYRSLGGLFVHNKQLIGYLALMFLTSFTAHPASKV